MESYISKDALVAEIKRRISLFKKEKKIEKWSAETSQMNVVNVDARIAMLEEILSFIDTIEIKNVNLIDKKTEWSPSKKQIESLKDLLKYNIGEFDYQKFMDVNSLYEELSNDKL